MQVLQWLNVVLDRAGAGWFDIKMMAERSILFHDDALHVLAGTALQLSAALILRTSISRLWPWLIVLALELLNEFSDFRYDVWPRDMLSAQIGESVKDVLLTMALPTVLLLVARRLPRVLR
jgi:hypothetical protein